MLLVGLSVWKQDEIKSVAIFFFSPLATQKLHVCIFKMGDITQSHPSICRGARRLSLDSVVRVCVR